MVACHRASIDEVLTLFSIVLTGTFHGSTNFELMRNNITRVTLCVAVLAQRATMPISCPVLCMYAQAFMRVR